MDYFPTCSSNNNHNNNKTSSSASSSVENNKSEERKKQNGKKSSRGGGVKLSTDPQSIAARERRHRISDRFKILQSLVPGGTKMDTVSMLEEAIHYVKYLKTQIWLHQTMINCNDDDPSLFYHGSIPYEQQEAYSQSNLVGTVQQPSLPPPPLQDTFFQGGETMSFDANYMNY
ncbi:hypothetical protein L1049_007996 [Liquidambar formosana]|uniref:BHLH domain-containing protein n=1 Tax=Liquidambar formosana TaxID=63359 RepID=A0AAP0S2B8_LIQFO